MVTKLERENNTIFYLHNAWANSPDGTAGFTLEETEDATYIGNCISMSSAEVLNPSSYNWIAVEFEAVEESDTAELTELGEDVPEDPEDEDDDYSYEDYMDGAVQSAADTATTAQESADIAQQKAEEATASAALAQQKAEEATASAAEAKTAADTAREKAEAATTDAATAKQKAESATAAAGAAHAAAESATSDARTAGIAAATAQAAAEAAQGDIDDQKKYFYHDKLGAHVLDAAGGAYRTDIKSDGVQIVQTATETPIASYGETSTIGATAGNHVTIAKDKMAVNAGPESLFSVDSFKSGTEIISTWINTDKLTPTEDIYPEISDSIAFSVEDINRTIDLDGSYSYSYNYSFYNKGAKRVWFELEGGETITINKAVSGNSLHYEEFSNSGNEYFNGFTLDTSEKITRTDIIALRAAYDIEFNPAIVDIGQYRTKDVINYQGMNLYDFKALKIGSGIASENNRRDAFTVDFLGNGYFGNTLNVEQNIRAMYVGAMQINANKISAENISADNITMNILRGTGHSKGTKGIVTEVKWSLYGKVATVEATFKATSDIAAGTDMCTGTFTGIPTPINSARGAGAYGKNPMIFGFGNTGVYFARNCGTESIGSGKTAKGVLVYLTDGTML